MLVERSDRQRPWPASGTGVTLNLLGAFGVLVRRRVVGLPAPAERLVALLAVGRSPLARSQLAGTLWPDRDEHRALANVRAALWQANKRCPGLVAVDGAYLAIGAEVEVDLWQCLDWCDRVLVPGGIVGDLHPPPAAPLAPVDLLPTWSEEWLDFARHYHRLHWLQAVDELGGQMLEAGDPAGALRCALTALGSDRYHERSHELAIAALIAMDRRVDVVRHHDFYRRVTEELGLEPSPRIEELVASVVGLPVMPPLDRSARG